MSRNVCQTRFPTSHGAAGVTVEGASKTAHKGYSDATAARVVSVLRDLELIEDVVTISSIARRTGVSRSTVRAVLRRECGWTPAQSCEAHHAGIRRGKLLQAVAGHPGLAQGRATLQIQGWPNLQRAQQALRASDYAALQRGRESQAAHGWPGLMAARDALSTIGYPHLAEGRANLAARGWPNWQVAQDALKAQDYLPLLEAQRLRKNVGPASRTDLQTDRRRVRGRTTRLAILEALQALKEQSAPDSAQEGTSTRAKERRVSARAVAAQLHLHPATVYAHLRQMRQLSAQEMLFSSSV